MRLCLTILPAFVFMLTLLSVPLHSIEAQTESQMEKTEVRWVNAKTLNIGGQGWSLDIAPYNRLPGKAMGQVPAAVWDLSQQSAGISITFITSAQEIQVRWTLKSDALAMPHMPATGVSGVDLYQRDSQGVWQFRANGRPTGLTSTAHVEVEPQTDLRLYLPLYNGVAKLEIGVPSEASLQAVMAGAQTALKPLVFYGTSITQGGCVSRPGLAAPAIVGRELDRPVINLGFSGSGKMELVIADLLSELDPEIYILDCLWNMNSEMVRSRVAPFVARLRQSHPETPILLVEDSNFEGITPTEKGQLLKPIYVNLRNAGDSNLYYLSNSGMLGSDFEGTVDGCHPNDLGMMRQAQVFRRAISRILAIHE